MGAEDVYGVTHALGRVPYADGAEETVLRDLLACVDRSEGSDELATLIRDWPTRYHFSPLRANLLRPLTVRPGMRVLEVGCGTGALTRWLGEQGASVHALEGNVQRARAAAVRCQDLPGVEVVAGTLDDIPSGAQFDAAVVVGVLEYSTAFSDARDAPARFLQSVTEHLGEDGVLVLAIENQLGLKYLLGYGEDHLGLPWVGIEGYTRTHGPRTWSRRQLAELLQSVGLHEQRWLFPFPDYKLPTFIADERLYARADGIALIDQFVRSPVTPDASAPHLICDARLAHRQLLSAGLGPEVSNSFLVIASRAPRGEPLVGTELAWFFGDVRRRQWRRRRTIVDRPEGLHLVDQSGPAEARSLSWLRQERGETGVRAIVPGQPVDSLVLEAIRRTELDKVSKLLARWRAEIDSQTQPSATRPSHPFAPKDGASAAPEDYLDVNLANFVLSEGALHFIDREWVANAPVCAELVQFRALWWFARELVETGESHPWGPLATVDEIAQTLCGLAGVSVGKETLPRWRDAEAELQCLVKGEAPPVHRQRLEAAGARRTVDVAPRKLPFTALSASLEAARQESRKLAEDLERTDHERVALQQELEATRASLQAEAHALRLSLEQLESLVATARVENAALQQQVDAAETRATAAEQEAHRLRAELAAWKARMARIEQRLPVRVYRVLRRSSKGG